MIADMTRWWKQPVSHNMGTAKDAQPLLAELPDGHPTFVKALRCYVVLGTEFLQGRKHHAYDGFAILSQLPATQGAPLNLVFVRHTGLFTVRTNRQWHVADVRRSQKR